MTELSAEAEAHRDPTPGEIAYEQAMQALSATNSALGDQWRREYDNYAARLTEAVEAQLAGLQLSVPVFVSITCAPESYEPGAFDEHAPPLYPRNAIETAVNRAITDSPTPAALPAQLLLDRCRSRTSHSRRCKGALR
ncbi:hypothetical protein [Mycobacterium sp. NAZ190054]|uniref:hypothetical protein n=1 Tax=Mycobacterium sp. NAZ190054 TaxID=1747766 RepID=UPI0012E3F389|nr:hypothetical protein [Mycobacterium sp. NAZ190054]